MRAMFICMMLLAMGSPAVAWETCDDAGTVRKNISDLLPSATIKEASGDIFDALMGHIQAGVGRKFAAGERVFLIVTAKGWGGVRIISIKDGCYEDYKDIDLAIYNGLVGKEAAAP